MGRFLGLSALALLFIPSTYATLAVEYSPVTGVSQDGLCGSGVTCVGSGYGNCCSVDGICGSTDTECGTGCQSLFGICPTSSLQKRVFAEIAQHEFEKRDLEVRATSTSSACKSASTTIITCNASNTAIIKKNKPHPKIFCKNWNASKPHTSSPFKGIAKALGVSKACDCILADTSATASATSKTSSVVKRAASTSTCNATNVALIREKRPSTDAFCTTWLANRPHSTSPFGKIPKPIDVTAACECILSADGVSSTTTSSSATSTPTVSMDVTKTACNATNVALITKNRPSTVSFCTTWLANRPHSSSPFGKIPLPADVSAACSCIIAAASSSSSSTVVATSSSTTKASSSSSSTAAAATTSSSKTSTSVAASTTSSSKSSTSAAMSTTSALKTSSSSSTSSTSKTSSSTTSSSPVTSSACTLKKRRRRRRRDVEAVSGPMVTY